VNQGEKFFKMVFGLHTKRLRFCSHAKRRSIFHRLQ